MYRNMAIDPVCSAMVLLRSLPFRALHNFACAHRLPGRGKQVVVEDMLVEFVHRVFIEIKGAIIARAWKKSRRRSANKSRKVAYGRVTTGRDRVAEREVDCDEVFAKQFSLCRRQEWVRRR